MRQFKPLANIITLAYFDDTVSDLHNVNADRSVYNKQR